jgi:hypothetical protein
MVIGQRSEALESRRLIINPGVPAQQGEDKEIRRRVKFTLKIYPLIFEAFSKKRIALDEEQFFSRIVTDEINPQRPRLGVPTLDVYGACHRTFVQDSRHVGGRGRCVKRRLKSVLWISRYGGSLLLDIQVIGVRISFLDGVESSLGFGKYLFVFFHFRNQLWAVNKAALSTRRVTWGTHYPFPFYPVGLRTASRQMHPSTCYGLAL